ncbi:glucan biosynthesis protein G [Roseomonas sp. SSH11]|uniref:Glucan biosynthesis protein G n=2 Tax=Pararoseomonas baculiformis TaxID=2820812 RepID=A0ABS4ADU5_9PROT|nr:glucan biosynthesis protein G [Pararoseomonas baculiformis]MBP0445191.1 glucan biosynthesis protein G [Pararoseomonas baculiformis]
MMAGLMPTIPGSLSDRAEAADDPVRPFDDTTVRRMAREMATKPFSPPDERLPGPLSDLSYDAYRRIQYDAGRSLWRPEGLPFQMQPFHRGFLFRPRVPLFEVANGRAAPIRYDASAFSLGDLGVSVPDDLGFAGFRLTHPLNRPDHFDEVAAFVGASYFRAIGQGHVYGLSARGLAIATAERGGEEFPIFRAFWLQRPQAQGNSMVVHALLDSPSTTGAYRFTIRPGADTVFDVESVLYPRVDMPTAGIAPLTSMFLLSPLDRLGTDDYRTAVHDSDGLMLSTGRGEAVWRPLANPRELQVSVFADANPRGFGLMQRRRSFRDYNDLEARYDRRPGCWVEPIGDWGEGAVHLVEIPTKEEIHDNIAAFWRPRTPLRAGQEYSFVYRLHWASAAAFPGGGRPPPAQFEEASQGAKLGTAGARLFVLEAKGGRLGALPEGAKPVLDVSASVGRVLNPLLQRNEETGAWRASFELVPGNERLIELRALLRDEGGPLSETWLFRWTP